MNSESMHPSTSTSSDAFSFISRGWQGVRDSAGADIQLIRDRANSFKNLTSSFVSSPSENAFVKKIQPTISELRRAYSAPEISKKVLEKWEPTRAKLGIDLSSIRNALVSEVEGYGDDIRDVNGAVEFDRVWRGKRRLKLKEFWGEWKVESEGNQYEEWKWKPLRDLKKRFKNSELVEKMISSLKSIRKDPQESQEVPPLDGPELLACLVKQSVPFLDQLGVKRDVCDKIVESLCSKRKNQLLLDSLYSGESSLTGDDNVHDELDLRIASVLQSTGHHYEGGFWTDRGKHIPADGKRHVAIVTTASLPWMTGTAVNPLFRAAYLSQSDTNYLEYIKREKNGALQAFLVKHINNWVARAYCHKVLRLSAATQDMPKSLVCNVHGVNPKFLRIGEKVAADRELGQHTFSKGAYFLGKMVWAKGYRELIDLLAEHKTDLDGFKVDVFGNGEDAHEVKSAAKSLNLNLNFLKGIDHADDSLHGYKLFINPSVSDVLCTATAEALAMGKFVVCADHPSNEFFRSFPNCLTYKSSEDFVTKVKEAMEKEPQPLTPEQRYHLSWEAATQRFMQCSDLDKLLTDEETTIPVRKISEVLDGGLAFAHYCLTGSELLRLCTGATPGTRDYDKQHCKDLRLLPPHVENPIYGW
ncbi:Digalactosyldiacylglycerol synthase 1, chloroplastic [Linum perenne]